MQKVAYIVVFLIGLTIRLYYLLHPDFGSGDAGLRYIPIARNLLDGHGFALAPGIPDSFDQPLYPLMIAGMGGNFYLVVAFQFLLELAIVALVYGIAKEVGLDKRGRIIAISLAWLCPFLPLFASRILTEVLATLLLTLTCYLILKGSVRLYLLAGLCAGLALLTRGDALPAVILLPLAALSLRRPRWHVLAYAGMLVLTLSPWMIRNQLAFGSPRPVGGVFAQTQDGYRLWLSTWLIDSKDIHAYHWNNTNPLNLSDDEYREQAKEARDQSPVKILLFVPAARVFISYLRMPGYVDSRAAKLFWYPAWGALGLCVLIGMLLSLKARNWPLLIPAALILSRLALPFVSALGCEPRYQLEAMPVMIVFASIALVALEDAPARGRAVIYNLCRLVGRQGNVGSGRV